MAAPYAKLFRVLTPSSLSSQEMRVQALLRFRSTGSDGSVVMNRDTGLIEHVRRHMTDPALLKRITVRPEVFGGKPIIRDMRISVELILSLLAQGVTPEAILDDYPDLTVEDIRACLAYAHAVIAGDTLDAVTVTTS